MVRAINYAAAGLLMVASTAFAEVRELLLVVQVSDGTIAFVDPATGVTETTVRVGVGPNEIAISPDGTIAVVANYGHDQVGSTLSVVDLVRSRLMRTIRLRYERHVPREDPQTITFHRPHGIVFTPDQQHVLVTCEAESALLVVSIEEGRVVSVIDTLQELSHMVVCSNDGRLAFVANESSGSVTVVNLHHRMVETIINTGGGAQGMALHPTLDQLWVANSETNSISVIDTDTLEEIEEFPCGAYPVRLAITNDGEHVLCVNHQSGTVTVFKTDGHKVVTEIRLEKVDPIVAAQRPIPSDYLRTSRTPLPSGILMRSDGKAAYVSCSRADRVAEIDTATWEVTRYIETARQPDGLAWSHYEDDVVSAK